MKKTLFATALGMACVMSFPAAHASSCGWTGQRIGLMGSGAVVGTLVAGPVGTVLGAAIGDWLDGSSKACDTVSTKKVAAVASEPLIPLEKPAMPSHNDFAHVAPFNTKGETAVYFSTGSHTLTVNGKKLLSDAATVLKQNPAFDLAVIGGADPRAKNGYDNMSLSMRRATSVKNYLTAHEQINNHRIFTKAIGAAEESNEPYSKLRVAKLKLIEKAESSL